MSSSRACLKFWRHCSVKSSTGLFKKCAYVVGLENVAAKKDTCRSRGRNFADHIERMFVRGMTASTEHQDRYRTFFHHRTHGELYPRCNPS